MDFTKPINIHLSIDRRNAIKQQYSDLVKTLPGELGAMIAEFADSWWMKNHKGEPLPDKDERVILAKKLLSDSYSVKRFLYGNQYQSSDPVLEGADNRKKFSIAFLYSTFEGKPYLDPSDLSWCSGEFRCPETTEIESTLQLKTSRHRKKVLDICEQLKALFDEYKSLEGK